MEVFEKLPIPPSNLVSASVRDDPLTEPTKASPILLDVLHMYW